MFAQAEGRTANPWTMSISIVIQCAVISAAILIPLLRIEALPAVHLSEAKIAPPHVLTVAIPDAIRKALSAAPPRLAMPTRRLIQAPTRIPQRVEQVIDVGDLADFAPVAEQNTGAPLLALSTPVAPPPAPPVQSPKQNTAQQQIAAPSNTPYRVGGDVKAPVLRSAPKPAYPPLARQARVQGTVRLNGIISRDGTVRSLELVSGHPLLVQAAIQAVRTWLYDPARLNGQIVDVILVIDVNFTLTQ